MKEGLSKVDAMRESIKIRTRPILMTAFAVAIGGLIVGTFLTLLFIPLIFIWFVKEHEDLTA